MAIASSQHTREFVAPSESTLPPEQQTVWILRPITVFDELERTKAVGRDTEAAGWLEEYVVFSLRRSLCGWRNFKDAAGVDVPQPTGFLTDEQIVRIPKKILSEIGTEVFRFEHSATESVKGES